MGPCPPFIGALTLPFCPVYIHSSFPSLLLANSHHVLPTCFSLLLLCPSTFSPPPTSHPFAFLPLLFLSSTLSSQDTVFKEPLSRLSEEEQEEMGLRYYDSDIHRGSFTLPHFARKVHTLIVAKYHMLPGITGIKQYNYVARSTNSCCECCI